MFESLQESLQSALKSLRGKGKMTEANMRDGLRLVEQSLLEADVSYTVIKDFMARVTEKSLGQQVLKSLDPSQQVVGIVYEELVQLMGPVDTSLHLRPELTILMLCGLQGSGKTTTCGKLARYIQQSGRRPLLAAADLQRPAAIDQLHVIGQQLNVPVYSNREIKDPVRVCREAVEHAKAEQAQVVILDTAGRLAIDQELMDELSRIDRQVQPDQVYLVVDGMTGQDAVESARAFNTSLELDGLIMTKLDGDARGGALLSVKHVTGVPIKFLGTGEQLQALEPFRPDGMAQRILGMGDIVELVRTAQQELDQQKLADTEKRLREGQFTLEDFRVQLAQLARPGLLQRFMSLMPGMGELKKMMQESVSEGDMKRLFGIIDSMTPEERRNPQVINQSRRHRIAQGSGAQAHEVNELIKQFDGMASIMKSMAGKGIGDRMRMAQELQKSGMLDPGGRIAKPKVGTGKRLSADEKRQRKKLRDREMRKRRRNND